jgi:class 3 adenylate cyclase
VVAQKRIVDSIHLDTPAGLNHHLPRKGAPSWTSVGGCGASVSKAFRENKVDAAVLPKLTAEDLRDLGVVAVGDRRKLLEAIAALRNDESVQTPPVAAAPARPSAATPTPARVAEAVGERRHVTVMFCDLVGSTSISAGLDAEDWRDLVGAYLDAATAAVTEMGGHVAS